ncbi:extracellular solute-binding protein [Oerskovia sp. M15]
MTRTPITLPWRRTAVTARPPRTHPGDRRRTDGGLGACGTPSGIDGTADDRTLTVLAAASLRDVFADLAEDFEAEHEGVTVALSFAGSADLADQLLAGSPGDVFASADTTTMDRVVEGGDAADPVAFATNSIAVVVPAGNPADVTSFADLSREDLRSWSAPRGAVRVRDREGRGRRRLDDPPRERGGERDRRPRQGHGRGSRRRARLPHRRDARGDDVEVFDVPETGSVVNTYPIAVTSGAADTALAQEWLDLVTGPVGQGALAEAGFGAP